MEYIVYDICHSFGMSLASDHGCCKYSASDHGYSLGELNLNWDKRNVPTLFNSTGCENTERRTAAALSKSSPGDTVYKLFHGAGI